MINQLAYKEYGQFILVDPPIFDPESNMYYSNVRSDYPVFIHDDRDSADYKIRVLKIKSLGQIYLNEKLQIIPQLTTTWEECNNNLETLLSLWRDQAEHIVLSCSSDRLVRIEAFRNHFNQIELIIDHLKEFGTITSIDIRRYMPRKHRIRIIRYLNLLEGLELVRETKSGYVPSRQFISLEEAAKDEDELRLFILSYVIKNRYLTLRDVFKITILEKTVNIDNVVYLPELELEQQIYRRRHSIAASYKYHYKRNINPLHLTHILRRLEKCEAICRRGQNYFGDDDLRESMLEKKKTLQPLTITDYL